MANRDKSQNVGFVYTNIYQIYKNAQNAPAQAAQLSSESRVWRAEDLQGIEVKKFEPRTLAAVTPAVAQQHPTSVNPFEDLKANMNKLNDLHSKLRFMLKELEDLVSKK